MNQLNNQSTPSMSQSTNNPVKGKTVHQDTDETKVIGIFSAVILFFTVLTISSYADDQAPLIQKHLISEQASNSETGPAPILINTTAAPVKNTEKKTLKM